MTLESPGWALCLSGGMLLDHPEEQAHMMEYAAAEIQPHILTVDNRDVYPET